MLGLEQAGDGHLTFLANPKYAPKLKSTSASAVLASRPIDGIATLISSNPYHDFARALELFYQPPRPAAGIHRLAAIAPTAKIGDNASIGPFVAIGENVTIGRNAVLHPNVVVYEGATIGDDVTLHSHSVVREFCRLGNRVILQNGVVVGGDGFGFAKRSDNSHHKIVQSGVTIIEDDVEVQSLTSVDRASIGETRIRRGAKVDSLVQIGHACVVGEDNIICSQTGLAGSTILEKNVLLAGQVGISGHLTVHEGAIVYAQSGVGHDVPANTRISGSPAFDASEWLRAIMAFKSLPEILKTVRQLKKQAMNEPKAPRSRPPLAYKNEEFLKGPDSRPLRIISEYLEPLSHFRRQRIRDTIVFFGSARIKEDSPLGQYYNDARKLAEMVTTWAKTFRERTYRFVVCSGGGPGIMEAANRGAMDARGKTVGLNIGLPFEQFPNPYITHELSFEFHYFFMRKFWFAYLSKALVVFPGGFGTMDELFEILTLAQTKKLAKKMTIILYGSSFWKEIINFDALVKYGTISPEDMNLFHFADTPEAAMEILRDTLIAEAAVAEPEVPAISHSAKPDEPASH